MLSSSTLKPMAAGLALVMLLSACVTSRPSNPSGSQSALYDYSESYAGTGALSGAAFGAVAGCLLGAVLSEGNAGRGCAVGGAVGGVGGAAVGAAGGLILANSTRRYATAADRLDAQLAASYVELDKARQARAAAERVVIEHQRTLDTLRAQVAATSVGRDQLIREISEADFDRDQIVTAIEGLERQISVLNEDLRVARQIGDRTAAQLERNRDDLIAERNRLDAALGALTQSISAARGVV